MLRYYFDVIDGDGSCLDEEGSEWPDAEAARAHAIKGIRSLLCSTLTDGLLCLDGHIRVRSQHGSMPFDVSFGEAVAISN